MNALVDQHCTPRRGEAHRLPAAEVQRLLTGLPGWSLRADGLAIVRELRFKDFLAALAYVNALADVAEAEDHHPDLELGYGRCTVCFNTHDVGGLSLNDFICAAKAERLYAAHAPR